MIINDNIKLVRELSGLTQAEFAKLIKTNISNLKTYENTDVRPKAFVVFNVSTLCGVPSEDLEKKKLKPEDIRVDTRWLLKDNKVEPGTNDIAPTYERLILEIEERRKDAEEKARVMERHYEDVKADKEKLFTALEKFNKSLDTNLNVIQASLTDNRNYLQLIVKVVRSNDAEIMDGMDHLEKQPIGTHRKKAGNTENAVTKAMKDADKKVDAGK